MAFSSQNLPPSTTRKLQDVDFSDVDFVFFERSLTLPNYTLSRVFGGQTIDLFLYNIICANITVGEVNIDWRVEQPQDIYVNLLVDDFDTTCTLDFTYSLETFQSGGWAEIFTSNSSIAADLLMQSSDLSKEPPSDVIVRDCDTNIKIDSVEFVGDLEGDFIVDTLNGLEGTLRGIMANEIGSAVCSSFGNVEDGLSAVFLIIADLLNPYVSKEETNPLYVEKNLTVPNHIQLVNFLQTESSIELLMDLVFGVASEYLATPAAGDQLVVDGIVRDLLLPDDKTLKINVSSIEYDFLKNPLEDLAEYGVAPADFGIMAVRFDRGGMVRGLDNFYSFDAIQQIGKHTVEVSFTLEEVLLDLLGTIDIRPNDGDMTEVDQTPFEVNLNMTKVDASIFFLLALDEKSLSDVQLGNFLGHGNLTCLLYSLYDLQITKVSINDFLYQPPTIGGLEDVPIVDALSNAILGLGFTAFDSLLADALPEILRQNVESFLEQFDSFSPLYNESCVEPTTEHVEGAYLDFRDLLLSPALAQEYGTNGSEPYGSFIPDIKDVLDRTVFADSPDTYRPFINERTVSSFTKRQSGEVGKINSEGVFFSYSRNVTMADLQAQVGIQLADLFLDNINTFYSPMNLFDPVKDLGTGLDNFLTLGDVDSPFRVAFNLIVDIDIDGGKYCCYLSGQ